ncbi:MAG: 30S ribosomal protein S6 [Candidatus Yanofskybacteria bacterium]|nr:30S ribosomal protein S6 [Candidatus Yanofskybacteria bacterium]
MTDLSKQNYELAFHITANLEDADVQKNRQELERIITSHGGVVSFAKDPDRIRLAYPIKHQTSSYFGFFNFILDVPEAVDQIRDEVKMNGNVLRFLILKHEARPKAEKEDMIRRMAQAERRKVRAAKDLEKTTSQKTEPKMGAEEEKALDSKLEEILEKI